MAQSFTQCRQRVIVVLPAATRSGDGMQGSRCSGSGLSGVSRAVGCWSGLVWPDGVASCHERGRRT